VAKNNMDLTKYPVSEVMQSIEQRLESLRRFYPEAKAEDWRLEVAGQRVQIIKKDPKKGGVLQFGTELVAAKAAGEWASKLKEIVLACEKALETDAALYRKINSENDVSLERVERSSEAESYSLGERGVFYFIFCPLFVKQIDYHGCTEWT
jgi:malate dehydrogenase (quinone)